LILKETDLPVPPILFSFKFATKTAPSSDSKEAPTLNSPVDVSTIIISIFDFSSSKKFSLISTFWKIFSRFRF